MRQALVGMAVSLGLFASIGAIAGEPGERGVAYRMHDGQMHNEWHGGHVAAPEIDARSGLQAMVLLGGVLLLVGERVRRPR